MTTYKEASRELEARWQAYWRDRKTFRTINPGDPEFDATKPKSLILDMFPYPSGIGLHIGHPLGYIATDIYSRFKRMRGFNVLHSMGFDAFGLPAEQFAIQTGQHPRITTETNIANMLAQLARLGLDHDPERRFATTDPDYVKWTQWIFLQLFESYFDPREVWTDPSGRETLGRARPIAELVDRLRSGAWRLDAGGTPVPADAPEAEAHRPLSEDEMADAVDKARLAYLANVPVNWCPMLGTVLSNEEVTADGRSERGDFPVYRRQLKQWMLRITVYAERLVGDLALVDWPTGIIDMQKNWIGASDGAEVSFPVEGESGGEFAALPVFTTRPDTIFGVTYFALAPESPAVQALTTPDRREAVDAYLRSVSAGDKDVGDKEKTGVFTGRYCINPVNGERVPIWVADYVLMEYGTGAVMGVPGHDQRDFDFCRAMDLPTFPVVAPTDGWLASRVAGDTPEERLATYRADMTVCDEVFTGQGVAINSSGPDLSIDGLGTDAAKKAVIDWLKGAGAGRGKRSYKLRDWLFSRQRFWGEPFPVVFDDETGRVYPLADGDLPVELPDMEDFAPQTIHDPDVEPQPPLARAADWTRVRGTIDADGRARLVGPDETGPDIRTFRRETSTMPNWAGSCWYYLRYMDSRNDQALVAPEHERYWSGTSAAAAAGAVDLYVGGAEHAVLHLLYARFWHKVLFDLGFVTTPEPFAKLFNQGMITADAYKDGRGFYVDIHDVEERDIDGVTKPVNAKTGEVLTVDPGKMGKRYKNGIPPEEICDTYSADVLRLYEMYMGPLDASKPWRSGGIVGMQRFLDRAWRLVMETVEAGDAAPEPTTAQQRQRHKTVKKVTEEVENLRMNTAIAAVIEWTNEMIAAGTAPVPHARTLVLLLAPFAPHLAEELFSRLCPQEHAQSGSVARIAWPDFDPALAVDDEIEIVVQVNGKRRGSFLAATDESGENLSARATELDTVARHLEGKTLARTILAPPQRPRIVNFVVR